MKLNVLNLLLILFLAAISSANEGVRRLLSDRKVTAYFISHPTAVTTDNQNRQRKWQIEDWQITFTGSEYAAMSCPMLLDQKRRKCTDAPADGIRYEALQLDLTDTAYLEK
eukprot:271427_1